MLLHEMEKEHSGESEQKPVNRARLTWHDKGDCSVTVCRIHCPVNALHRQSDSQPFRGRIKMSIKNIAALTAVTILGW